MSKYQPDSLFDITRQLVPAQTYKKFFQANVRPAAMLTDKMTEQLQNITETAAGYSENEVSHYPALNGIYHQMKSLYDKMITQFIFHKKMTDKEKIMFLDEFDKNGPLIMLSIFASVINDESDTNSQLFIEARKAENSMLNLHYEIRDHIKILKQTQFRENFHGCKEIIDFQIKTFKHDIGPFDQYWYSRVSAQPDVMMRFLKNMKHFHSCYNTEIKKKEKIALILYLQQRITAFMNYNINMFRDLELPEQDRTQLDFIETKLTLFIDETKRTITSIRHT